MNFEGTSQRKSYLRSWTLLSTGELRYRNLGWHSPNLESLFFFMSIRKPYPGFRITYAKLGKGDPAAVLIHAEPRLTELRKNYVSAQ